MKKFLSLAVVCAALAASVGCDDKNKSTGSPPKPANTATTATTAGGAAAK